MTAWLPVVVLAIVQITVRVVGLAGRIWQERERAKSHCAQMRAASASGVVLYERRGDGVTLLIVPQAPGNEGENTAAGTAGSGLTEVLAP